MAGLNLPEDLERWAFRCLPTKNTLTAGDARLIEDAFRAKLKALGVADGSGFEAVPPPATDQPVSARTGPDKPQTPVKDTEILPPPAMGRIDKSLLAIPLPRRLRDKAHLRFVAHQPCLLCGRLPCDPHHLRFAQSRGLGLKVSDEFTVPLCRAHHRELHRTGKESDWWAKAGLEPISLARNLWRETHPHHASADVLDDDGEKPGAANDEVTTMSRQQRAPRMAKRTQLPGTPT